MGKSEAFGRQALPAMTARRTGAADGRWSAARRWRLTAEQAALRQRHHVTPQRTDTENRLQHPAPQSNVARIRLTPVQTQRARSTDRITSFKRDGANGSRANRRMG